MQGIAALVTLISRMNGWIGRIFSWLTLAVVLICFSVVLLRYAFAIGFVWMQDIYVWLNGIMFTGFAGYTLLRNGHVRVDIFYRPKSLRFKAWVDLLGFFAFLLPFVSVVFIWSWNYVARSWQFQEGSLNTGGLEGLYLVKSFLLVFCVVVGLQGLAMAGRGLLVLGNRQELLPPDLRYGEA